MRDTRAIGQAFERYQRERHVFVNSLADLSKQEGNVELIEAGGGLHLLHSLLLDPVPGVRCTASVALGRLAMQSETASNKIVADGVLETLVKMLGTPTGDDAAKRRDAQAQRRAAAYALRGTAKHGIGASRAVVEAGGLQVATAALATSDAETREAIAWLFDCIAAHSDELAQAVIDANAIPALVACLEYSEIALKRAATAALGSIAQHGEQFAHIVASAGALQPLVAIVAQGEAGDLRLSRNVLCTISQIVQGGSQLASQLVALGALPNIARCLGSPDELVRRFAAAALRDVIIHGEELAHAVVNTPRCLQLLVESTTHSKGLNALPGVMALGHCCDWSPALAEAVIVSDGLSVLTVALAHNKEESVKCAAAWALGQAGKHCPAHAQAVAESGALLALTGQENNDTDLAGKCTKAACAIIAQLATLPALDALLRMPVSVRVKGATLERIATVLASDPGFKAAFVQSGGLQLIQELGEEPGSPYQTIAAAIASLYPQELVNRFSPAYNRALMEGLAAPQTYVSPRAAAPLPAAAAAASPQAAAHFVQEAAAAPPAAPVEEKEAAPAHHLEVAEGPADEYEPAPQKGEEHEHYVMVEKDEKEEEIITALVQEPENDVAME